MRVSRSDVFVRSEKGSDWLNDFLKDYANKKESSDNITQELMDVIKNKEAKTVESVVQNYKELVGLDTINNTPDEKLVSTASAKSNRTLSKRAENELEVLEGSEPVSVIIERYPQVEKDVESLCRHSGGNKSVYAIINYLRNMLGNEIISYNDDSLISYIKDVKDNYTDDALAEDTEAGLVGVENDQDDQDQTADYIMHGDNRL